MLKFNIQITLKSDEKIISKIWAVVDDYWYDGTLCLSDDVIASISSGEDLLNALYQFCFPRGDKKYMLTDSDFTVRDKNGIQDYKKIFLSLKDLSAVQEIIIKARYEEYGFSCSDSYEINNMNCPYIFDGSLTLKSKQIPETEREKEIVGIEELELSPCDFRALRLITKNKIYILYWTYRRWKDYYHSQTGVQSEIKEKSKGCIIYCRYISYCCSRPAQILCNYFESSASRNLF